MTIRFACLMCHKSLKAPDELAGRTAKCPDCGTAQRIPRAAATSDSVAPATSREAVKSPPAARSTERIGATADARRTASGDPSVHAVGERKPGTRRSESPDDSAPPNPAPRRAPSTTTAKAPAAESPRVKRPAPKPAATDDPWESFSLGNAAEQGETIESAPPPLPRKRSAESRNDAWNPSPLAEAPRERRSSRSSTDDVEEHDIWVKLRNSVHWVLLLAMAPLVLHTIMPRDNVKERLESTFKSIPALEGQLTEPTMTEAEVFGMLPGERIQGAYLSRFSVAHWRFAMYSGAAFLGLLMLIFPRTKATATGVFVSGFVTGTLGIFMLLTLQVIAEVMADVQPRGRSVLVLIVLFLKFIGYSYRCASDDTLGFWGSFFGYTCGVGFCEEACKIGPVLFYLFTNEKRSWRTACLVGLASGVGFGVSEGIHYSGSMYNGVHQGFVYLIRFISCVGLHALWAGAAGIMMHSEVKAAGDDELSMWLMRILRAMAVVILLHGLYDTLLQHNMPLLALMTAFASFLYFELILQWKGLKTAMA